MFIAFIGKGLKPLVGIEIDNKGLQPLALQPLALFDVSHEF
jgi:hypothetical protein